MAFYDPSAFLNLHPALLFAIVVWTIVWKGLALWKSAHKESPIWFVFLLVLNTFGILEILYIFIFSGMKKGKKTQSTRQTSKKKVKKKR